MPLEPIFVDTSAFYALMDRSDMHHENAKALWPSLLESTIHLRTSNYVVTEAVGLIQYRLGCEAASLWYKDVLPVVEIDWIDEATHRHGYQLWVSLGRRRHSLVDCTSYVLMHKHRIEKAFCFKQSYIEHDFQVLPLPHHRTKVSAI